MNCSHELKCWPGFFDAIVKKTKPFEIRRNDRDFKYGDRLMLREFLPDGGYTGRCVTCIVSYLMNGPAFGIEAGYCVMGLAEVRLFVWMDAEAA